MAEDGAAGELAIEVAGLRKSYPRVSSFGPRKLGPADDVTWAVRGLSLHVRRGEIFAFLGPNGAGKTTTVEILEAFRRRDGGDVRVLGVDPARGDRAWRARIGMVLQEGRTQPNLTVRETLELWSAYYPRPKPVAEIIGLVGLEEKADVRSARLSGGQRRRLDVGLALVGDPELIFLDEPTTGFDPQARRAAWLVIAGLRDLGKTVFLTTHYLDEAQELADRVAIIKDGVIVAEGPPAALGAGSASTQISFVAPAGVELRRAAGRAGDHAGGRRGHRAHRAAHPGAGRAVCLGGRAGNRARAARGDPADAGGRLPRAHRVRRAERGRMTDAGRALVQLRADLKVFVRNPAALFFTAILPVIFLTLFIAIFGNASAGPEFGNVRVSTLQVPAFIALAVVSASFVGLAIGLVSIREDGVLKRVRGTPVPPWIVFAGRIGTAFVSTAIVTTVLCAIGAIVFGVTLPTTTLPGLLLTLAVGAAAFCALGIAYTALISSEDAAPAMTNAVVLPLYFISGVFVPVSELPDGLATVAGVLPVKPFVDALFVAFDPRTTGAGIAGGDLAVLAAWGVAGLLCAVRFFVWTPRQQAG